MKSGLEQDIGETLLSTGLGPVTRGGVLRLARGETIGRYVVIDRLGEGGMGVVYSAFDPELDRKLAIKLLRSSGAGPADATDGQTRLLREAQAMARLSHPNVVTVHDVGTHADQVYVAMEFVDGWTLKDWLAERAPHRREILDVCIRAGRGLAAAHAKGLVHRDFKPDNVMVSREGAVRVMDFGLARVEGPASRREPTDSVEVLDSDRDALNMELTAVGSVMGTPAYMAPEQHLGADTDARTDQFSYCVSVYEALYGQRPFRGDNPAALALATTEGMIQPPPGGARVPAWIRRVLLRGLIADPARRWPDMNSLLAALEADPTRRRRAFAVVGVGLAAVLALVGGMEWSRREAVRACETAGAQIEASWNQGLRDEVARRLSQLGERGDATWSRFAARLDAHVSAWSSARLEVCEASTIERTWTAEERALGEDCLLEVRDGLDALVEVARSADAVALNGLVTGAASLADPAACADRRQLSMRVPLPEEAAIREAVLEQRRALLEANALEIAGRLDEGLVVAEAARGRALELGFVPLQAEAAYRTGILIEKDGRPQEGELRLQEAVMLGIESGQDEVAARAAVWLARTVGNRLARKADGLRWGRLARAIYARLGVEDDPRIGELEVNVGLVYHQHSMLEEAQAHYERGLAIREATLGEDHPLVAEVVNNIANIYWVRGELETALEWHARARGIRELTLGPAHPSVASSLNNIGLVYVDQGNLPAAREAYEQSIEITRRALGPDHRLVGITSGNLALVLADQGELDEADAVFDRARRVLTASVGADNPGVAEVLRGKAGVARRRGELERAEELVMEALRISEKAYGPENADVAELELDLAELRMERGEVEGVREVIEAAQKVLRDTYGEAEARLGRGEALLSKLDAPAPSG